MGVISRRRTETASAADSQPSIASRRFSSVDDRSASAPPSDVPGPSNRPLVVSVAPCDERKLDSADARLRDICGALEVVADCSG